MSVGAHKNINHANLASVQLNSEPAVTSISVSARIDYIQRFSKQAVLVVDPDATIYAQAARQFLINLSKEKSDQEANVAFVSASTKLNDIQMRCRLIEQLYANTLFDPEKSLAVSVLNLSKQSKDSITIVVEHAHSLSLQMKYELCQLVDVANKTQSKINVALFGLEATAKDISSNKSIFKNKLAIVEAQSGQLLALDHPRFKDSRSFFNNKFLVKLLVVTITIAALTALSWFTMINYDNFSLSELPSLTAEDSKKEQPVNIKPENSQLDDKLIADNDINEPRNEEVANSVDIQAALLGEVLVIDSKLNGEAEATDILQALSLENKALSEFSTTESNAGAGIEIKTNSEILNTALSAEITQTLPLSENSKVTPVTKPIEITQEKETKALVSQEPLGLNQSYYLTAETGFVVQLVGFTDLSLLTRFILQYPELETYAYQKQLNNRIFFVLTTKVYKDKTQAQEAINTLPQAIIDRGVWVKSLSVVKDEINNA